MKNHKHYTVTPELKQTRNEIILRMRKDGFSLQKIGDRFNVTREYIRQILLKEFDITGNFPFDPQNEVLNDEYTVFDIAKILGVEVHYISFLLRQKWIPKPSRLFDKSQHQGLEKRFWKRKDIDKWIQIRLKYLKIHLERSIKNRMSRPAPYRFGHHRVQELYNILQMAKAGDLQSLLLFKIGVSKQVMQEFYNQIKPAKYIPTDYSKYINMKTTEDYEKLGLFDGLETAKITNISTATIKRYKKIGVLKENNHYIVGDHYFHRTMYYPDKVKQAIIDAGYDVEHAAKLIAIKSKSGVK